MNNNISDLDRLVILIISVIAAVLLFPGVIYTGVLIFIIGFFKKKKVLFYILFSAVSAAAGYFFTINRNYIVLQYFGDLWNVIKSISENRLPEDIDFINLIIVSITSGSVLFLLHRLYIVSKPEWVKKKNGKSRGKVDSRTMRKLERAEHPDDGTVLGLDYEGNIVKVSDRELNGHCLVLGATGSGKTTTIMNFIDSAVKRGIPAVVVDGKGELEFAERVKRTAENCGRVFKLFSMKGDSLHYNPLRHGNFTEIKDKLISITEWTEPHYKLMSERYLQSAARILMEAGEKIDLVNTAEKIEPHNLEMIAKSLDEDVSSRIFLMIDEVNDDIGGLLNRLSVLSESEIGELLSDTRDESTIDLIRSVEKGEVVFFSLDSLRFPEYSRLLGRLIVIDLKTTAARMFGKDRKVYTVFDEFGVFAGTQVTDFINKSRGAGFHVILSTQELADLRVGGKTELMEQVLGNTNIKIIHRQDVPSSAELLSSLIGTEDDIHITYQVNNDSTTGMGTVKEEKSFIVHPDEIKRLRVGEAFTVKKFPEFIIKKVWIKYRNF